MAHADPRTDTTTDLGIIQVRSVNGTDTVRLTHNKLRAFTLRCRAGEPSSLQVNKKFFGYPTEQWQTVFVVYLNWKRQVMPDFKIAEWRGHTKDGHKHPWSFTARKHDSPAPGRK